MTLIVRQALIAVAVAFVAIFDFIVAPPGSPTTEMILCLDLNRT
jgi:hypothetical protein